jgi:hypothetical protein
MDFLCTVERRRDLLAKVMRPVRRSHPGIALNEHYEGDGAIIYKHACRFGCEGIGEPSRFDTYQSGRGGINACADLYARYFGRGARLASARARQTAAAGTPSNESP